jgi:hypothetical protein
VKRKLLEQVPRARLLRTAEIAIGQLSIYRLAHHDLAE